MFLVHGVVRVCIFILQEFITQPSRYLRLIRAVQDANLRLYVFLGDRESFESRNFSSSTHVLSDLPSPHYLLHTSLSIL